MFAREVLRPLAIGEITVEQWVDLTMTRLLQNGVAEPAATALVTAQRTNTYTIDHDVLGWLAAARTQMPVWLLTNQAGDFAESMAGSGVLESVDGVINSADVGVAKPDLEIYRIAAQRVGVMPEQCLFVDDRPANTDAASQLGMTTVLYRTFADLNGLLPGSAGSAGSAE